MTAEKVSNFERVKIINTLLERLSVEKPITVKTCSELISTHALSTYRAGRFSLDLDEHEYLVQHDGYYCFMVLRGSCVIQIWFVRAKNLRYRCQVSWTTAEKAAKIEQDSLGDTRPEATDVSTL